MLSLSFIIIYTMNFIYFYFIYFVFVGFYKIFLTQCILIIFFPLPQVSPDLLPSLITQLYVLFSQKRKNKTKIKANKQNKMENTKNTKTKQH